MTKAGESIRKGIEEAVAFAKGQRPSEVFLRINTTSVD